MESKPIVLGAALAAAEAAERARLASGTVGPSPLAGTSYNARRGDCDLISVIGNEVDERIESLVTSWHRMSQAERDAVRQSLNTDDNYTLIHFARRSAVRVLNEPSEDTLELGLTALAMVDETRIDPRDASWAAGIWHHAAKRFANGPAIRDRVAVLSTAGIAQRIHGSAATLAEWGFREINFRGRIGLVRAGWSHYLPNVDLVTVMDRIVTEVLARRYRCELEIATDLPAVWFARDKRDAADRLIQSAHGIANLHGTLQDDEGDAASQLFIMWLAEMPSASDCSELTAYAGTGNEHSGRLVVTTSAGNLFALFSAGSAQQGVAPRESRDSVSSLAAQTRTVLLDFADP